MTTLRGLIEQEMEHHGEAEADIEKILVGESGDGGENTAYVDSLDDLEAFEENIDRGKNREYTVYWEDRLPNVHMWTAQRVYLKGLYDGSEWVTSLPRHPSDEEPPESVGRG